MPRSPAQRLTLAYHETVSRMALSMVAQHYRIPEERLRSDDNVSFAAARARWVAAGVASRLGASPGVIGQALNRDRCTVIHGLRKIKELPQLAPVVDAITEQLRAA